MKTEKTQVCSFCNEEGHTEEYCECAIEEQIDALEIFNYLVFQKENDKMTLIDLTKED